MSRDDLEGEYTRFKAKIQLGDGPDQRGEITIETVREVFDGRKINRQVDVELSNGETVQTTVDDSNFAEFYLELGRGKSALWDALGLDEDGGGEE